MVTIDIQYGHLIVNEKMLTPGKIKFLTTEEKRATVNYLLALKRTKLTTSHFITKVAHALNLDF